MIDREEKVKQLFDVAKATRTPISCSVEITQNCNFGCPHCFIKGVGYKSLEYKQFISFIDQFCANGGIFLSLTGGEVLLHPNFSEMYMYAYRKGLSVTVFTNGYLIDDDIINLFVSFPPRKIEISLYGANEDTYFRVTQCHGAYHKIIANIERLLENKINLHLKSTVFQQNFRDLISIKQYALERNIPFRYDFKLMPKRNGEKINLVCQLYPNQAIEMELNENPNKLRQWKDSYYRNSSIIETPKTTLLFNCGAARYSCFLSSENHMRMCAAATFSSQDMSIASFSEIWTSYERYTKMLVNTKSKCIGCTKASLCDICPIWGFIINDDINCLGEEVELHCSLANERLRVIQNA